MLAAFDIDVITGLYRFTGTNDTYRCTGEIFIGHESIKEKETN